MRRTRQADDPIGRKQKKIKVVNETGIEYYPLWIALICFAQKHQRSVKSARRGKRRSARISEFEMEAAANAKAEKNRTAMLSDAKNAVKFWRSLVPRKCQFRCGERIMDEDYQYHITPSMRVQRSSVPPWVQFEIAMERCQEAYQFRVP